MSHFQPQLYLQPQPQPQPQLQFHFVTSAYSAKHGMGSHQEAHEALLWRAPMLFVPVPPAAHSQEVRLQMLPFPARRPLPWAAASLFFFPPSQFTFQINTGILEMSHLPAWPTT